MLRAYVRGSEQVTVNVTGFECVDLSWIMLGWIFKKWAVGVRTGLGWLRIGIRGGRL
jgi:hypothetical protein